MLAHSIDSLFSHLAWVRVLRDDLGVAIPFPIVEDPSLEIAHAFGMVDAQSISAATVRATFFLDPDGVVRALTIYPLTVGRSVDEMLRDAERAASLGIGGIILFGIPDTKDEEGTGAWDEHGPVAAGIRALKREFPQLVAITDVCMCEYTSHGHCGIIRGETVDNDATLQLLAREAVCHAQAGADIVAPSDMMDGRVAAIRQALDGAGFSQLPILSYAAKYASAFYGPFRDAVDSAPQHGDRRGYQMDPANAAEAVREVTMDVGEGADIVMVKPALAYLDVIRVVADEVNLPIACYNVSGEYAMIEAAAANGWIDRDRTVMETLTGMRRAGADILITYHAMLAAKLLAK